MNILARTTLTSIVATLVSIQAARLFRASYSFEGKAILITGARGLALILARMLAEEGARLTLVARDPAELQRAEAEIREMNGTVFTYAADLRNPAEAEAAVLAALAHYGQLDVLINKAFIYLTHHIRVNVAAVISVGVRQVC